MNATDFKLTDSRDGSLSEIERRIALQAAQDALDLGDSIQDAELAACRAAFANWARWPESAELVIA